MINSVDDVIAYSETIADPDFWEPALERPGIPPAVLEDLEERVPGLPESYLRCIADVQVFGRELGHFRLSPPADDEDGQSFAEAFVAWNEDHILADEMDRHDLVEVAAASVHSLCVERGGDGRIVWLEERDEGEPVVRELAPSFADLLVMAGRYDQATRGQDTSDRSSEAIVEEIGVGIDLTDEQRDSWADLIS